MLRVGSQVRANEHEVQDVGHAGPRARLLLQQRGHQRMQIPAVARRDGRKPPTAGMGVPAGDSQASQASRLYLAERAILRNQR